MELETKKYDHDSYLGVIRRFFVLNRSGEVALVMLLEQFMIIMGMMASVMTVSELRSKAALPEPNV